MLVIYFAIDNLTLRDKETWLDNPKHRKQLFERDMSETTLVFGITFLFQSQLLAMNYGFKGFEKKKC